MKYASLIALILVLGCGGVEAPQPPPVPAPTPTPTPTPEPPTEACGAPQPPPAVKVKVRRFGGTQNAPKFDASGLVGPSQEYCKSVGFTDGRWNCVVRPDCSGQDCLFTDREFCELEVFGVPAWRSDGELIQLPNIWQIKIRGGAWVEVCAGGKCAGLDY